MANEEKKAVKNEISIFFKKYIVSNDKPTGMMANQRKAFQQIEKSEKKLSERIF